MAMFFYSLQAKGGQRWTVITWYIARGLLEICTFFLPYRSIVLDMFLHASQRVESILTPNLGYAKVDKWWKLLDENVYFMVLKGAIYLPEDIPSEGGHRR